MNTQTKQNQPESIEFSVHPASQQPIRSGITLAIVGMIVGAVYQSTQDVIYSALALGILLVTLAPYFLKTVFILDHEGVTRSRAGFRRRLKWSRIRRTIGSEKGVYLSIKRMDWRDTRGIYVMFSGNQDEVMAWVDTHVKIRGK